MGPNKEVALSIIRDGNKKTINLKLGQLEDQKVRKTAADDRSGQQLGSLGLTVKPAADVEGASGQGLAVVSVDPSGKAAELGLQPGDVILRAGNRAASRPGDLTAAISEAAAARAQEHAAYGQAQQGSALRRSSGRRRLAANRHRQSSEDWDC
jgi:serine protease Do